MSCLEVRQLPNGGGKLCDTCRAEPGPVRSARFAVFLLGHPADLCCAVHGRAYEEMFRRRGLAEEGAEAA